MTQEDVTARNKNIPPPAGGRLQLFPAVVTPAVSRNQQLKEALSERLRAAETAKRFAVKIK